MILRDGTVSLDPRLTRLVQFDERSREFSILDWIKDLFKKKEKADREQPRSYTWRCEAYLDQGREGACVGFGIGHELAARPVEIQGLTETYCKERIYWEAQRIDPWEGGAYPGAKPFYEGTSVLAGVKVAQKLGYFESYRWAFGLEQLKLGVSWEGPAVLGLHWYEGMFEPNSSGYIRPTGELMGGHCILCRGINLAGEYFLLHNSWGKDWGQGGTCKVSFKDMDALLRDSGEAVFFQGRKKP